MEVALHTNIEKVIKRILASELNVSAAILQTISPTTPLLGRGIGLDSSETVALILGLEEEFGIAVPDTDLTADLFKNIGTLTEYVHQNISGKLGWQAIENRKPGS